MARSLAVDVGLDKLQDLLLALKEGDDVTLSHAVAVSGLQPPQCEAVLEALVRAGLMMRAAGEIYVRTHQAD
jgi:hypothetical protein